MKARLILALGLFFIGIVGCSDFVNPLSSDPMEEIGSGTDQNSSGTDQNSSGTDQNSSGTDQNSSGTDQNS